LRLISLLAAFVCDGAKMAAKKLSNPCHSKRTAGLERDWQGLANQPAQFAT